MINGSDSDQGPVTCADAELVDRARENDEGAFGELVRRHRSACLRRAMFLLRDREEAEDEVQNAVWKAFTRLDQFKGTGEFSHWLARIVTNHCLIRLRRRSQARMFYLDAVEGRDADELPSVTEDPEYCAIQNQMATVVRREIRRIPTLLRSVVLLRDVQNLPFEEVARRLGITVQAAKSRLFRARTELQHRVIQSSGSRRLYTLRSNVQDLPARSTRCPVGEA